MTVWTDDRTEQAKALWADGYSASQIVSALGGGLSRNAVIGKMHRLGIKQPETRPKQPDPQKANGARVTRRSDDVAKVKAHAGAPVPRETPEAQPDDDFDPEAPEKVSAPHVPEIETPPESKPVLIEELTDKTCRFPLGPHAALPPFQYCGAAVQPGAVYCRAHCAVCYQLPQPRRRP